MKKKVFLLHNIISPPRLPLFEKLSEEFDLDVKFCKTISKDRLWSTKLDGYSFKNEVLRNISSGPLIINYSLPFKLLFNRYDVYICAGEISLSNYIALLISKLFRKPFIIWSGTIKDYDAPTDSWMRKTARKIYRFFNKLFFYNFADAFIAYGIEAKEYYIQNGVYGGKIFIGTQVISNDQFKRVEISKKDLFFPNKKIVLFLSYFYKFKCGDILINAFKKINRNDIVLIMAGAGEEEEELKALATRKKDIYFPGYVQGKEKAKYYLIADIFVFPTFRDAWGLVINEAMMYGLPIITTENAGCSKELINGNGFVVKAGNEEELRFAIEKLLDDDELRKKMGIRSKEIIKKYNNDYAVSAFKNDVEYATRTK